MPSTLTCRSRAALSAMLPQPQPTSSSALAGLQLELRADQVELGLLGLLERGGAAAPVGAAVGHRRIEEQLEEVVAGVVVVAHGAAVARDRVALAAQPQLGRRAPAAAAQPGGADQSRAQAWQRVLTRDPAAARSCRRAAAPRRGRRSRSGPARRRGRARARPGARSSMRQRLGRADEEGRGAGSVVAARESRPRTRSRTAAREARVRARAAARRCWRTPSSAQAALARRLALAALVGDPHDIPDDPELLEHLDEHRR